MEKIEVWLCPDCTMAAVNDDYTGLDYYLNEVEAEAKMREIQEGLAKLGPNLVSDFGEAPDPTRQDWVKAVQDEETEKGLEDWINDQVSMRESGEVLQISHMECDCCGEHLAGPRYRFAIL